MVRKKIRIYKVKYPTLRKGKGWRVKYGEETLRTFPTKSKATTWTKKWKKKHPKGW